MVYIIQLIFLIIIFNILMNIHIKMIHENLVLFRFISISRVNESRFFNLIKCVYDYSYFKDVYQRVFKINLLFKYSSL